MRPVYNNLTVAKEKDIEDAILRLKQALIKSEMETKQYHEISLASQKQVKEMQLKVDSRVGLEKELEGKAEIIGQLRHDISQLQSHLSDTMKYLKKGSSDDMVDR